MLLLIGSSHTGANPPLQPGSSHRLFEVNMGYRLLTPLFVLACFVTGMVPRSLQGEEIAIRGARIMTMEGEPIDNGTIIIRGSKIEAVGSDLAVPSGAQVVEATGLTAMPGIIDAEGVAPGHKISGITGPMRAELIAGDFFDPYGQDYRPERTLRDLVEWGVTAINVKMTDSNVFDGVSSVVKIHAPRPTTITL